MNSINTLNYQQVAFVEFSLGWDQIALVASTIALGAFTSLLTFFQSRTSERVKLCAVQKDTFCSRYLVQKQPDRFGGMQPEYEASIKTIVEDMLPCLDVLRDRVFFDPKNAFVDVMQQLSRKRAELAVNHTTSNLRNCMSIDYNPYLEWRDGYGNYSVPLTHCYEEIGMRAKEVAIPLLSKSLKMGEKIDGKWNDTEFTASIYTKDLEDETILYSTLWFNIIFREAQDFLKNRDPKVFWLDVFRNLNEKKIHLCRYGLGFIEDNGELRTTPIFWGPGKLKGSRALKEKCARLFGDILLWKGQDPVTLRSMVGEFLYCFTLWHPYQRGSASLGILFENLFYRFHNAGSLSYNHDYMVDLEVIAAMDRETFLEGYLEKGFVKPPQFRL